MRKGKAEVSRSLSALIERVFSCGYNLGPLREHARTFTGLINRVDPFIQKSTQEVCPQCRQVCCINRHSYHTHFDVLCLMALGEEIPHHKSGLGDSEPCQFLSSGGCRLGRSLRPYRCTWYFCTPLLEYIRNEPVREYRTFIACLERLSAERELLLTSFIEIAKEAHLAVDVPMHDFY